MKSLAILVLATGVIGQVSIPFERNPDHETDRSGVTTGGAFADLNRDGWPDLVVANGNDMRRQRVAVYTNLGDGRLPVNPTWQSADIDYHGHLDVGDVDGDGWPDLVVAVFLGPNGFGDRGAVKLYRNDGQGQLGARPAWTSSDRFFSFSCALGDVDGDGDLDLAVATGEPYQDPPDYDRVYTNTGGNFSPLPTWTSATVTHTMDVAFADADGDGWLDLGFAGAAGPNYYYRNLAGTLPTAATWTSSDGGSRHNGNTCAFADVDADGRLDLTVSDNSQLGGRGTFRVYRNLGSSFSATPWWESQRFHNGYSSALAWCDFDRDGDHDLFGGGWWTQTAIYSNQSGALPTGPVWETSGTSVVEALFFADVNRDGLRTVTGEAKITGGGRRLFGFDHGPVQSLQRVVADGVSVAPNNYAFHRDGAWICLANVPAQSLVLDYTYSEAADLGVTNWDTSRGNYLYYRRPLVDHSLTPPTQVNYRGGEVVRWTETLENTAANPQAMTYHSVFDLPNGLGTLPFVLGSATLPGAFATGPFQQSLAIPLGLPPVLLGTFRYRVESLGPDGTVMASGTFAFTVVP